MRGLGGLGFGVLLFELQSAHRGLGFRAWGSGLLRWLAEGFMGV